MKDILKRLGYVFWWASWVGAAFFVVMGGLMVFQGGVRGELILVVAIIAVILGLGRALKYILSGE